jgi:hypothetical protein
LITAIYQNGKEFYAWNDIDYEIRYFLIEQSHKNLIRIIEHFNMLRPKEIDDKKTITFRDDFKDQKQYFQLNYQGPVELINRDLTIFFHPVDMYSSGQLMQKISAEIKGHNNNRRQIFVIESLIQIQMDWNKD